MQVDTPVGNDGIPLPAIRLGNAQNVTCNAAGGGANQSAAFGANTRLIMVSGVSCDVRIAIGAALAGAPFALLLAQMLQLRERGPGKARGISRLICRSSGGSGQASSSPRLEATPPARSISSSGHSTAPRKGMAQAS